MNEITEYVFRQFGNTSVIKFTQPANFDSSGFTRTQVVGVDQQFTVDTAKYPDALTWNGNELTLKLGDVGLSACVTRVRIVVFINGATEGIVIVHENSNPLLKLEIA